MPRAFGLDVVMRVGSAHKTSRVTNLLAEYEEEPRPRCISRLPGEATPSRDSPMGRSLPGDCLPTYREAFGGADIFSSLRMPSGIAPALVLEPANAALLGGQNPWFG